MSISGPAQTNVPLPLRTTNTTQPEALVPRIQFAEKEFDFGKLNSGDVVKHSFRFTNIGTAMLEIKEVRPSCGCTTAGVWDKQVEPGGIGSIPLQFNSTGFGGAVAKVATVICNDPTQSNVLLRLKGTVWKPIDISPATVSFTANSEFLTNETKIVRIVNNESVPLVLSDLQCTNAAFQADLRTIQAGKEFELQLTALAPFPVGTVVGDVTMKTSSSNWPVVQVRTYLFVPEPLTVSPRQVVLPGGPLKSAMNLTIAISNNGTRPVSLSEASINHPGVDVQLKETQPGLYALMLTLPVGFDVGKEPAYAVSVQTTHPRSPSIRIPIVPITDPALSGPSGPSASPGLSRPVFAQPQPPRMTATPQAK
jgi:hypothetical protein